MISPVKVFVPTVERHRTITANAKGFMFFSGMAKILPNNDFKTLLANIESQEKYDGYESRVAAIEWLRENNPLFVNLTEDASGDWIRRAEYNDWIPFRHLPVPASIWTMFYSREAICWKSTTR